MPDASRTAAAIDLRVRQLEAAGITGMEGVAELHLKVALPTDARIEC